MSGMRDIREKKGKTLYGSINCFTIFGLLRVSVMWHAIDLKILGLIGSGRHSSRSDVIR